MRMSKHSLFIPFFIVALAFGMFAQVHTASAMMPVDDGGDTGGGGGGGGTGGGGTGGGDTGGGTSGGGDYCGLPANTYYEPGNDATVPNDCTSNGYTLNVTNDYRNQSTGDGGYEAWMQASTPPDGPPTNLNQCAYAKPASGPGYILLGVWEDPTPPTCDATPAPTANLSATPTTIDAGSSTKLTWSSTNASSCSIDHSVLGSGGAMSGNKNVSPSSTTTYTLTCTGSGGTSTDTAKVTVNAAPQEEVNVTCSVPSTAPVSTSVQWSSFAEGGTSQSTSYNWKYIGDGYSKVCTGGGADVTTNIQDSCPSSAPIGGACSASQAGSTCNYSGLSCTEQPDWMCDGEGNCAEEPTYHVSYTHYQRYQCQATVSSSDPTYTYSWTGSFSSSQQNPSTTYSSTGTKSGTVRATAQSGYATDTCSVNVLRTTASLGPDTSITAGDSVTLNWSSTNAGVCTSPDFNTGDATSGSVSVHPTANKTYHITCEGDGGEASDTATITVTAAPDALNASCSVSPTSITTGGSVTWTAYPSGGTGTYAYSWSGTDSLSGSSKSITKTYSSTGPKTGKVTVTSGAQSKTVNCSNSVSVGVAGAPDLTAGSVSPTSATVNTAVSLQASVQNAGSASANSFPSVFQIDGDTSHTQVDTTINAGGTLTLAAGESSVTGLSRTFTSAKTYYVRACANMNTSMQAVVSESNYSNNCGAWTAITIAASGAPDLTAGSVSPTSAVPGTAVTLKATISNTGNASTGAGFTALFQKATNSSGSGATDIGTASVSTLGAGSSAQASKSYTFSSAGTYYVRACADKSSAGNAGVISESNENNNCGGWTAITAAPLPAGLSCTPSSTSVTREDKITYTANNGSGSYTWSTVMPPTPIGGSFAHTSSISVTASISGTYRFKVQSGSETATCPDVTVSAEEEDDGGQETLTCRVSATTIAPGESVTYTTTPGHTAYVWHMSDGSGNAYNPVFSYTEDYTVTYDTSATYVQRVSSAGTKTTTCPAVVVGQACTNASATISASKDRVQPGESVTLTYSASGIDGSCTVSGPGVSKSATANACTVGSSTATTPGLTTQSTYTIACDGGASDSVTINVIPKFQEF